MLEQPANRPIDWDERQKAVDINRSCIVQAPAGSGKTELLIQRILALLAVAETPEEILAITFTRKAAGEMRVRLLEALERAENDLPPEQLHAYETWQRARSVLARDQKQGWGLRENPSRLQLMTIDSLCAFLTRRMPWLARFGDQPQVTNDPSELYRLAAERLIARVDRGGAGQESIERLLRHLDNRMTLLRDMLVNMLGKRDQWLRHLMAQRTDAARQLLESGLSAYVSTALCRVHDVMGDALGCELFELGSYAAKCLSVEKPVHQLLPLLQGDLPPRGEGLDPWLALAHLTLTHAGSLRKSVDKRVGFPADKASSAVEMKSRMLDLLELLQQRQPVVAALAALRALPKTKYSSDQWETLKALIELLPLAVVELQDVFRARGQVDFMEIAGAAHAALGQAGAPEELLLQLDSRLRHILVDEFQDTSYAQYDLLQLLTSGWEPGDGRSLFIVGDPMQSIYRFREADVGLYLRVCERGLSGLQLEKIVLRANFRSQANLVAWVNQSFGDIFPTEEDAVRGAVCFAPAVSIKPEQTGVAVSCHGFIERHDESEAAVVLKLVRQARQVDPAGTIAVLVRSRNHLRMIVQCFKQAGLRFQAQDVDPLARRQVAQDLLALTRALLHPADRVAWLAVLRAPWCGLTLNDLATLCDNDARSTLWQLLTRPHEQTEMFDTISVDGHERLQRLQPIFERAITQRGRLPLRRLVETTWLALHGPACIDETDLADAEQVFMLLDALDEGGDLERLEALEEQLGKLFAAPDPLAGPELQVMTIHKAKGLEFDTVILPGLGRSVRAQERPLLRWLEHPDYELLLAPIPPIAEALPEPTYQAIGSILTDKETLESLRLLYVAVTRAKTKLHLLGHLKPGRDQAPAPASGSLLEMVWPSLELDFISSLAEETADRPLLDRKLDFKRLPLAWSAPAVPQRRSAPVQEFTQASSGGHDKMEAIENRSAETGRVVGVLVHAWLERIAGDGLELWSKTALANSTKALETELCSHGIPTSRLKVCVDKALQCLVNSLESERGRWLLQSRAVASCELGLNGLIDNKLMHAVVDRTFIDEQGLRWVVDYKTSQPGHGEDPDAFMLRELTRYQGQLQTYHTLFQQLEPNREIRAAIYFPMVDGWLEMNSPGQA